MKTWLSLAGFVVVAVAGIAYWTGSQTDSSPGSAAVSRSDAVVGVDEFMRSNPQPSARRVVEGVVYAPSVGERRFGLIDMGEFERCGTTSCPELVLPIRWDGTMPVTGEVVRVEGDVENADGKLIFTATRVAKQDSGIGAGS